MVGRETPGNTLLLPSEGRGQRFESSWVRHSSFVPAPLDPGLSSLSALGSMLTWNALRAVGFGLDRVGPVIFPLFPLRSTRACHRFQRWGRCSHGTRSGLRTRTRRVRNFASFVRRIRPKKKRRAHGPPFPSPVPPSGPATSPRSRRSSSARSGQSAAADRSAAHHSSDPVR